MKWGKHTQRVTLGRSGGFLDLGLIKLERSGHKTSINIIKCLSGINPRNGETNDEKTCEILEKRSRLMPQPVTVRAKRRNRKRSLGRNWTGRMSTFHDEKLGSDDDLPR